MIGNRGEMIRDAGAATDLPLPKQGALQGAKRRWSERRRDHRTFDVVLLALTVSYIAWFWSNPHGFSLMQGGSYQYLNFGPGRAAGYPVFVDAIIAVFGTVEAVPKVQIILSAAAAAFLGWCLHRVLRKPAAALLPLCLPFAWSEFAKYQAAIFSESLFVALLSVMLGALILLVERPTWRRAAVSALACGLAVAVRPAGMSLLPIWPIALCLIRERCQGRRTRMAAAVAAPIALCLLGESLLWRAEHGSGIRPNRADIGLYGKAILAGTAPTASAAALPRFVAEAQEIAAPLRDLIAAAPDFRTRIFLLVHAEHRIHETAGYWIFNSEKYNWKEPRPFNPDAYRTARRIGRAFVAADPVAWASNGLAHYWGYWTARTSYPPDFFRRFHAYAGRSMDHPFFNEFDGLLVPPRAEDNLRWVMAGLLLASLASTGLVSWRIWRRMRRGSPPPDDRLVVACLCGLLVHGHFLVVGLFSVSELRYAFAMWPAVLLCCLLLFDWTLQSLQSVVKTPRRVERPAAGPADRT